MIIYPILPQPPSDASYSELLAFFGGDKSAVQAYVSQLTSYADNGVEATELLEAASAAGTVDEAITILEGGASPITTYASLADVITAGLTEGTLWRIYWDAATLAAPYNTSGEIIGDIRNGYPSWMGFLPYEKWGTTLSDVTATGGTRTTDSDGRPRLNVTSTSGSSVETDLGMRVDRPQRVRLLARFAAPSPADGAAGEFGGLMLRRVTGGTIFKGYVGRLVSIGGWYGGANVDGSTLAFPNLDSSTDTSKFNPGKNIEFELQILNGNTGTLTLLSGSTLPEGETRKLQGNGQYGALGSGAGSNEFDARAYLTSRGSAMTLDLLGIQISGPPIRG